MATRKVETVKTEETVDTVKVRKFDQEETIPCRSVTSGGLYITGARSKLLYTFADYDDVQYIEYRDLIYMVRSRSNSNIYSPRIIILDDDFINQEKTLKDFYDSMYTVDDFNEILNLPVRQMVKEVEKLPDGAKTIVKNLAADRIDAGTLDSVTRIKALDDIFGTKMLLTLAQE